MIKLCNHKKKHTLETILECCCSSTMDSTLVSLPMFLKPNHDRKIWHSPNEKPSQKPIPSVRIHPASCEGGELGGGRGSHGHCHA